MKVSLVRRWGPHRAGKDVEVSDSQGAWLIQHNYASSTPEVSAPVQQPVAEGAHGADPLAGADATRRRPRIPRSTGSVASAAPGSSPTYRAGFDAEASARQGQAGLDYVPPASAEDSRKPRRPRRTGGATKD